MKKSLALSFTESEELINLTPLIDVLFTILVLFILISPLLHVEKLDLPRSGEEITRNAANASIRIVVAKNGEFEINRHRVSLKELRFLLKELRLLHPQEVPQLIQDRNSPFGAYIEIKHALETAGFDSMDLVVQPE